MTIASTTTITTTTTMATTATTTYYCLSLQDRLNSIHMRVHQVENTNIRELIDDDYNSSEVYIQIIFSIE